ncbi:MAG: GNAT family N-acetyltransferase [Bacilli bacterium]|jgi:cation diffusion facilitator family transporter|nr:GNAT family N-acetyltransferase [Bacilli bacterium]
MDKVTKVMGVSIITNIFLSIVKIITGLIGKSSALIADGIHSFSDLSTDFIAIIGNYLSRKPADEKHPYGHGKIEYITSIIISLVILFLGGSIIYNSIQKDIVIPSMMVAIISFLTIALKFLLSRYLIKKGKEYKNNILLASGYESSTDVISSIVVFISVLLMQLSNIFGIFKYADMIASIVVGLLIIKIGYHILSDNVSIILEERETNSEYLDHLKNIILEKKDIHQIDDLLVLKYGSYYKLVAEVSVDPNLSIMKAHQYIHEAENRLRIFDPRILYVTIHINPYQNYKLVKATKSDFEQINQYRLKTIITEGNPDIEEQKRIEKYIKETLKKHLNNYFMIIVDGKKVGTVGYYKEDLETILIEELYLEEAYRNCKIGTSILKQIMEEHKDKKIILWVYKNNKIAISLYQHLGFQKIEETEERIKMRK